jgi:hypothetical protein
MSPTLGTMLTVVGIFFSLIVGQAWVAPCLDTRTRTCYTFLQAWSVPYIIGHFSDHFKWGPKWIQWHLLDLSYLQWSTTLGTAACVVVARLLRRDYGQRFIAITASISLGVFAVAGYVWEIGQISTGKYALVDCLTDCLCYTIGIAVVIVPFIAFTRPRMDARPS